MTEVKIYTRAFCGYCSAALRFLEKKGIAYQEIDATGDTKTRRWLAEVTGQATVPQIFINGKSIGGYTDMRALDSRGELDAMLSERDEHQSSTSG